MKLQRNHHLQREFDTFVAGAAADLLRTAYLLTWQLDDAEDLVQECLLRVARRWPRVQRMDHPRAFARQLLVNLALDGSRGRTRRRSEIAAFDGPALRDQPDARAADELAAFDVRADVMAALATLPPRQRAVLVLRFFDDLTEAQAAQALGCTVGTIKSTASKALAKLREQLADPPTEAASPPLERAATTAVPATTTTTRSSDR